MIWKINSLTVHSFVYCALYLYVTCNKLDNVQLKTCLFLIAVRTLVNYATNNEVWIQNVHDYSSALTETVKEC